jgi:hypothetical protein
MQDLHRYLLPLCTAILAAAALTFAGCGSGSDEPTAQSPPQRCEKTPAFFEAQLQ